MDADQVLGYADQIASVAGATLGAAALALAVSEWRRSRRGEEPRLSRRHLLGDTGLREVLTRQWEDASQHAYEFFDGHVPAIPKIYVEQLVEPAGTGLLTGAAGVPGLLSTREVLDHERTFRHVLIVSGPGMGKSTLVGQILREQGRWWLDARRGTRLSRAPLGPLIPIAVPARLLAEQTLTDALTTVCGAHPGEPPVRRARWLILIDGLDEVLNARHRADLVHKLGGWLGDAALSRRFLVTTRPLSYGELADVRPRGVGEFALRPFNRADLEKFAHNWFGDGVAATFLARIASARLGSVVSVPLLATIAAIVFELDRDHDLPTSRAELYERFLTHLLQGRPSATEQRATLRRELERHGPDAEQAWDWLTANLRALLAHLADTHLSDDEPKSLEECAREWIGALSPARLGHPPPGWDRHVKVLLSSTGVLVLHEGRLAFTHRSLAEYLAAGVRGPAFERAAWLADVRRPDTRNLALFVLAHSTEDIGALVTDLLDADGADVIAAGDIVADGLGVGELLRRRVYDTLVTHLMSEEPTAPEALRVLLDLSTEDRFRTRLEELVGQADSGAWVRVLLAAGLDRLDGRRPGRLASLVNDRSLTGETRTWAAEQLRADGTGAPSAVDGDDPAPAPSVLAWHALQQVHDNRRGGSDYEIVVALALADRGVPDAVETLHGSLSDPGRRIDLRLKAARALLRVGGERWLWPLRRMSEDTRLPAELRLPAAVALAEAHDDPGIEQLRQLLEANPSAGSRLPAAIVALATLESRRPSASEQIWDGVPPRNPGFVGRERELAQLEATLADGTGVVALCGVGGIGKTAIATEYAYRRRDDYDVVRWIRRQDPTLPENPRPGRSLLIFDAAETYELPQPMPAGAAVIITTRVQTALSATVLPVGPFSRDESVALLNRRGVRLGAGQAERLAGRLGNNPLALAVVGSRLDESGITVSELLNELAVMPSGASVVGDALEPTLRSLSPDARRLVELLAAIDSGSIPWDVLEFLFAFGGRPRWSALTLNRAIRDLNRSGLIQVDDDRRVRILEPVRVFVWNTLTGQRRVRLRGDLWTLALSAVPEDPEDPASWSLLNEIRVLTNIVEFVDPADEDLRDAALRLCWYYVVAGDYTAARDLARQLVQSWTPLDEAVEQTQVAMNWLATALQELGDHQQAKQIAQQVLDSVADVPESSVRYEVALASFRIRTRHTRLTGRIGAACRLGLTDLVWHLRSLGEDISETVAARGSYAAALRLAGDDVGALRLDRRNARAWTEADLPDDYRAAATAADVVRDLYALGRYQEAADLAEPVPAALGAALGPRHPTVLLAERAFAMTARKLGRYDYSWAVNHERCVGVFGPDHQHTLAAATTLANTLRVTGSLEEAADLAGDTRARLASAFGEEHPLTFAADANLAVARMAASRFRAASLDGFAAARRMEQVMGPRHPWYLATWHNLSTLRTEKLLAEQMRETHALFRSVRGEDHPYTLTAGANAALARGGDPDKAAAPLAAVLGEDHPEVAEIRRGGFVLLDIEPPPI